MSYINQLTKLSDGQNQANQLKAEAATTKQRQQERRAKPLTEQISELMNTLPPALRERPWNMAELVSRLKGRYRAHPHPQMVGIALRALSWSRVRAYGKYDGARLWLPPTHSTRAITRPCPGE